jgi:hypothetical protein
VYSYNLVTVGDGRQGYSEDAPYNAIHVGAASPSLPHAVSYRYLNCHGAVERISISGEGLTEKCCVDIKLVIMNLTGTCVWLQHITDIKEKNKLNSVG